jgi:hypothetical protein
VTGQVCRSISRAREEIQPPRTRDRRSCVLHEYELLDRLGVELRIDGRQHPNEHHCTRRVMGWISRNGTKSGEREVEGAQWAGKNEAKEHVPFIEAEDLVLLPRVLTEILFQRLHGHPIAPEFSPLDEKPSDAPVGSSVRGGVAHLPGGSVIEAEHARSLHVQEEKLDRVVKPREHLRLAVEGAGINLCP